MSKRSRPEFWAWPKVPLSMVVHDQISDEPPFLLRIGAAFWDLKVDGVLARIHFPNSALGRLQQSLAIATQAGLAPSSIASYLRAQARHWPIYERLLIEGPDALLSLWDQLVLDASVTRAGKTLLAYACRCNAGPWSTFDQARVKSLDTRSKDALDAQANKILNRKKLLTAHEETAVVRLLDESALEEALSEEECEAHVALVSMYLHGMRPVQILSLRTRNVTAYKDADGRLCFVLSFHRAKQRGAAAAQPAELPRLWPPEWAAPVEQLLASASAKGRTRLFGVQNSAAMYERIRALALQRGVELNRKANWFRHSFAQRLADRNVPSDKIGEAMGHVGKNSPRIYTVASLATSRRVNEALGTSMLYGKVVGLANGTISAEELSAAPAAQQIAGVIGAHLVAGIGLCKRGQPSCVWDPVISCYGCPKFIPSASEAIHIEASEAMQEVLRNNTSMGIDGNSPMLTQLNGALAGVKAVVRDLRTQPAGNQ